MSKGGGGGYDTSAMEAATNKATALQDKIYEEGKVLQQPWYNAGSSAVSRLSDLLGLSGGGSVKTKTQLYDQLKPQYTTAAKSGTSGQTYNVGNLGSMSDADRSLIQTYRPELLDVSNFRNRKGINADDAQVGEINQFLKNYQGQAAGPSINEAGLNSAVDAQFAGQSVPSDYGTLGKAFSMQDYVEDPGYQFRLAEGQKGLDRSLAAKGKTFTGEAAKAAADYNSGMASQEFGNAYNRYNTDQSNLYNMLAGVSGFGQNSANTQVAAGQNYATNVGNLTTDLANAQTSAQIAKANRPSLFSQLIGAAAQGAGAYYGAR